MICDPVGSEHTRKNSDRPMESDARRIACAEVAAGNERSATLLEVSGLVVWVHSVPVGPLDAGGDVHYVSLCPRSVSE